VLKYPIENRKRGTTERNASKEFLEEGSLWNDESNVRKLKKRGEGAQTVTTGNRKAGREGSCID